MLHKRTYEERHVSRIACRELHTAGKGGEVSIVSGIQTELDRGRSLVAQRALVAPFPALLPPPDQSPVEDMTHPKEPSAASTALTPPTATTPHTKVPEGHTLVPVKVFYCAEDYPMCTSQCTSLRHWDDYGSQAAHTYLAVQLEVAPAAAFP